MHTKLKRTILASAVVLAQIFFSASSYSMPFFQEEGSPQENEAAIPALWEELRQARKGAEESTDPAVKDRLWWKAAQIVDKLEDAGLGEDNLEKSMRPLIARTLFEAGCVQLFRDGADAGESDTNLAGSEPIDIFERAADWAGEQFQFPRERFDGEQKEQLDEVLNDLEAKFLATAQRAEKKSKFLIDLLADRGFVPESLESVLQLADAGEYELDENTMEAIPQFKKLKLQKERWLSALNRLSTVAPGNIGPTLQRANFLLETRSNKRRGIALLETLASIEVPGPKEAHLTLARHYMNRQSELPSETRRFKELAVGHLDHAIDQGEDPAPFRGSRSGLLAALDRNEEARDEYLILFKDDPAYTVQLADQNIALGRESENEALFDEAIARLTEIIDTHDVADSLWIHYVQIYADVQASRGAFKETVDYLTPFAKSPDLDQENLNYRTASIVTDIKVLWAESLTEGAETDTEVAGKQLELLDEALTFNRSNARAKFLITGIARGDSELADKAASIYDVEDEEPFQLLTEATQMLTVGSDDLEPAIFFLDYAVEKMPDDPTALNNLSYALVISDAPDPERSLELVDRAIEGVNGVTLSYYLDTRARALMQLERYKEAVTTFEAAHELRPDHPGILAGLIECYESTGDPKAEKLLERLREIELSE